ncbi:MAG: sterol desaturase family protein [Proteobacteria bacterium]|nr:sterol desaturase family protein [Pseudomonadota bacterium]
MPSSPDTADRDVSSSASRACVTGAPRQAPPGGIMAYRKYYREHVRPRLYSPARHAVVHLGSALAGCAWAGTRLANVSLSEWLLVPAGLVVSSLFVHWFHRHVLHRPRFLLRRAYELHTLQHHRFFDYEHLAPDEREDLHIVLFPWFAGPALLLATVLLSHLLAPFIGSNHVYLLMLVANGYLLAYEAVHSVDHLPDNHVLLRAPMLAFLREHHRLHHDPALMGSHNFNVVLPLFDWTFGTGTRSRAREPASRAGEQQKRCDG